MKKLLFSFLFLLLFVGNVFSSTIITEEIISQETPDTNLTYVYDTSVYQIVENEWQTLNIFIQKIGGVWEIANLPARPLEITIYDYLTSDNINIKLTAKRDYYMEGKRRSQIITRTLGVK